LGRRLILTGGLVLACGLALVGVDVAAALAGVGSFVDVHAFVLAGFAGSVICPVGVLIVAGSGFVHFLILFVIRLAALAGVVFGCLI